MLKKPNIFKNVIIANCECINSNRFIRRGETPDEETKFDAYTNKDNNYHILGDEILLKINKLLEIYDEVYYLNNNRILNNKRLPLLLKFKEKISVKQSSWSLFNRGQRILINTIDNKIKLSNAEVEIVFNDIKSFEKYFLTRENEVAELFDIYRQFCFNNEKRINYKYDETAENYIEKIKINNFIKLFKNCISSSKMQLDTFFLLNYIMYQDSQINFFDRNALLKTNNDMNSYLKKMGKTKSYNFRQVNHAISEELEYLTYKNSDSNEVYIKLNNEFYILRKNNDKNIYATDAIFKNYFEDEFSEIDFKMTFKSLKTFDGYFDENNFNIIKDYFFKGKTYNYIYLYSFIDETIYFINKFENKPFASIEIEFDKFNDFDEAFSSKFLGSIH